MIEMIKKEELIKEVIKDWFIGKLTDSRALWAISSIIHSKKPSKEAIEWAKNATWKDQNWTEDVQEIEEEKWK